MSSDDTASWHMILGNLSHLFHLNPCLSSLVLSPGCWVGLGVAAECPCLPLVQPLVPRGAVAGQQAGGDARLWVRPAAGTHCHPVALGSSRAINLDGLAQFQPANCSLPSRLGIPGHDSGVRKLLFAPSPKGCYTKGGLVLKMKPVLFRNLNLDLRM